MRIDCYPTAKEEETHGWQTRYQGVTKFFADSPKSDRKRTPKTALQLAVDHLVDVYTGQAVAIRKTENSGKQFMTGTPGIRLVWRLNSRDFEEIFLEVSPLMPGKPPKRFYVGTCNTETDARIEAKMVLARSFRDKLVVDHMALREEQSMKLGVFLHKSGASATAQGNVRA